MRDGETDGQKDAEYLVFTCLRHINDAIITQSTLLFFSMMRGKKIKNRNLFHKKKADASITRPTSIVLFATTTTYNYYRPSISSFILSRKVTSPRIQHLPTNYLIRSINDANPITTSSGFCTTKKRYRMSSALTSIDKKGSYNRKVSIHRDVIQVGSETFPPEAGRYHVHIALGKFV